MSVHYEAQHSIVIVSKDHHKVHEIEIELQAKRIPCHYFHDIQDTQNVLPTKTNHAILILIDLSDITILDIDYLYRLKKRIGNVILFGLLFGIRQDVKSLFGEKIFQDIFYLPDDHGQLINHVTSGINRSPEAFSSALWGFIPNNEMIHESTDDRLRNALVGISPEIKYIRDTIKDIAPTSMNILTRGGRGTGKDIVASLLHTLSGRKNTGEYIKINCPSIPDTLLESELFGFEAGSFTGALKRKPGRLEYAKKGTIFLDEIGDISAGFQAKLLQFCEQKKFNRVGGLQTIEVDTRIIAATNAPLEKLISENVFRSDLYYRLNEYTIYMPALRNHAGDIPMLAHHFCNQFFQENDLEPVYISEPTLSRMMEYPWPGNVRELKAVIKRFVFTKNENVILEAVKQKHSVMQSISSPVEIIVPNFDIPKETGTRTILKENEKQVITDVLKRTHGNQTQAATMLGISYSSMRRRVQKFGLQNIHKELMYS